MGILEDIDNHNKLSAFIEREYPQHRQTQLFGATTDIDKTFREAPAGPEMVAGNMMLRAMVELSSQEDRSGVTSMTDIIRNNPALLASFDALVRDEGMDVLTGLEDLMKDENGQPVDPQQFAEMLQNPAQRDLFNQALRSAATSEHDMGDLINFARTSVALARDPSNAERQERFREQATAMGIDTSRIEQQAMTDMFRNFMQDPSGTLMGMGLDAQLVAALEPIIRFFTASLNYYIEGLTPIVSQVMEQTGERANELRAQHQGVETADVGEFVLDERGRIVQAVAAPADLEEGDIDPEREGRQQFANLGGNRRAVVTVDDERDIVYRGVTDTEFESAGGTQVRSTLKLGDIFAPRAEGRPETEPETAAASYFNRVMASASRVLGLGG